MALGHFRRSSDFVASGFGLHIGGALLHLFVFFAFGESGH
jgi:hypothetical protein